MRLSIGPDIPRAELALARREAEVLSRRSRRSVARAVSRGEAASPEAARAAVAYARFRQALARAQVDGIDRHRRITVVSLLVFVASGTAGIVTHAPADAWPAWALAALPAGYWVSRLYWLRMLRNGRQAERANDRLLGDEE